MANIVIAPPRKVSASFAAAAEGNYGANDVLSNSVTADAGVALAFENFVRKHGAGAVIVGAVARCSEDSITCRLRLNLFSVEPTSAEVEMDDNAVFDIKTSAGLDKFLGSIDLPAFRDKGAAGATTENDQLRKALELNGLNETTLYCVVETLDAESNETAGMTIDIDLYVE